MTPDANLRRDAAELAGPVGHHEQRAKVAQLLQQRRLRGLLAFSFIFGGQAHSQRIGIEVLAGSVADDPEAVRWLDCDDGWVYYMRQDALYPSKKMNYQYATNCVYLLEEENGIQDQVIILM